MARYEGRARWEFHPVGGWYLVFDPRLVVPAHTKFDLKIGLPPPHGPADWTPVAFDFVPIPPVSPEAVPPRSSSPRSRSPAPHEQEESRESIP